MIRPRKCNHSTWESLSHTICFAISISYQHISYLSRIHLCNNLAEYLNRRGSLQWPSFLYFYTPSWGTYQDMCEARLNDCELEDSINSGEIAFLNKENSAERSQAGYCGHEGWGGIQLKEAKVDLTYIDGTPFPKIRHRNLLNLIMGNSIQFSSVTQSCPILCDPVAWAVITYQ